MAPPATTMAQVVIYSEDMTDAMRAFAIEITQTAFLMTVAKGHVYSSIAAKIRDEFDQAYNGIGWNCVVGKDFGSSVTHEIKTYMYVHRTKLNTTPLYYNSSYGKKFFFFSEKRYKQLLFSSSWNLCINLEGMIDG
jgi:dynein light chain LC8-type